MIKGDMVHAEPVRRAFTVVCRVLERGRWLIVAALGAWFGVLLVRLARARSFWHDEVYTILTANLPVTRLWRADLDGVDLSPPLNTLLTHVVHITAGPGPVASRLPPILGFIAASVLLFLTVRRRTNPVMGIAAGLMLFPTPAWSYGVEARGYGLSLACFALALWAWTEAAANRRPAVHWTVMAGALGAGLWTHYYAVLAFLPIAIGEAVRCRVRRAFDPAPWVALFAGAAAALPLWPLMRVASSHRTTFWARPDHLTLAGVYGYILKDLLTSSVLLVGLALCVAVELIRRWRTGQATRHLAAHDLAASVACLLLPAATLVLGNVTHVFTFRYIVFTAVGIAFAVPQLIWWLTPDIGLADAALAVALVLPVASATREIARNPPQWSNLSDDHPMLIEWLKRGDPIALTGGVDYLGVWYSLPARMRPRAVHLADPASQFQIEGSDTVERGYLALSRWTPVPVVLVDDFVRAHPTFWLYRFDASWSERRLHDLNAAMTEVVQEPNGKGTIFKVTVGQ